MCKVCDHCSIVSNLKMSIWTAMYILLSFSYFHFFTTFPGLLLCFKVEGGKLVRGRERGVERRERWAVNFSTQKISSTSFPPFFYFHFIPFALNLSSTVLSSLLFFVPLFSWVSSKCLKRVSSVSFISLFMLSEFSSNGIHDQTQCMRSWGSCWLSERERQRESWITNQTEDYKIRDKERLHMSCFWKQRERD